MRKGFFPSGIRSGADMVTVLDTVSTQARPRHPEKAHRPDQEVLRKPEWIRVKAPVSKGYLETREIVKSHRPRHGVRGGRLPEYRRMLGPRSTPPS
jgi:hypothetical protein